MTIEQQLFSKLEPHAKRIEHGDGNDFDYLPAVLLQIMEEQKRQTKLLDETAALLASVKSAADAIEIQIKGQITSFESDTQRRMEQVDAAIKDTQTKLQNSQSSLSEQIAVFDSTHTEHSKQTKEGLSAVGMQTDSLISTTQRSNVLFKRLLIAGLVASTVMIGLAVAILQGH